MSATQPTRPKVVVWLTAGGILECAADPGIDLQLIDFQNLEAGDCAPQFDAEWDAWLDANAPSLRDDLKRFAPRYECGNCGKQFRDELLLDWPIPDLERRVAPGEPMPAGECPECQALVHVLKGPP